MTEPTPYEALIALGRSLRGTEIFQQESETAPQPTAEQVAAFLDVNRDVLERVRDHLSPAVVSPVSYDAADMDRMVSKFGSGLWRLTVALSRKIEAEGAIGEYVSAVRWGIDLFDFSNCLRRGGLMIDCLVSSKTAGIAVDALRKFRDKIPADNRRSFLAELARIDEQREPFAELLARERDWNRTILPQLDGEARAELEAYLADDDALPDRHDSTQLFDFEALAKLRLLAIDIALRVWQADYGRNPELLDELTPEVLPSPLIDPHSGAPFRYRRSGDPFVLYSVGCSGVDHDGTFGPYFGEHRREFDLCLDSVDYHVEESHPS